jgi:putative membrane protein
MRLTALPTLFALAVVCAGAPALSQTPDQAKTAHHDTEFLENANQGSVDEIDLAQIVLKKTNNADVKNFAQRMVRDHTQLLNNLKPFDNQAGLQVPDHPDAATLAEEKRLDKLPARELDRAYIKLMVEDHHKDLEAFIAEEKSTGYAAFKTAVSQAEEVVKAHLEDANNIAREDGIPTGSIPSGA